VAVVEIVTGGGPAVAELERPAKGRVRFLLVLTHGAGGTPYTPDVRAAGAAARNLGGAVALVTQPYRIRGARAPGSPDRQDEAWLEIIAALRDELPKIPLIQGGRSNGARVACRTAIAAGARGVVALAFPLHPPGSPEKTRVAELRAPRQKKIPVLVINGESDPFGVPAAQDADQVVVVPGETHALKGHRAVIEAAVSDWLRAIPRLTTARSA
jgi:uncharacterized protein